MIYAWVLMDIYSHAKCLNSTQLWKCLLGRVAKIHKKFLVFSSPDYRTIWHRTIWHRERFGPRTIWHQTIWHHGTMCKKRTIWHRTQLLTEYIQYKYIYLADTYSLIVGSVYLIIYHINVYSLKSILWHTMAEGVADTLQPTYISQLLA